MDFARPIDRAEIGIGNSPIACRRLLSLERRWLKLKMINVFRVDCFIPLVKFRGTVDPLVSDPPESQLKSDQGYLTGPNDLGRA